MGVGFSAPGFFVEGLFVPDAHRLGPKEIRGHPPQLGVEGMLAYCEGILPKVDALNEALLVEAFFRQGALV